MKPNTAPAAATQSEEELKQLALDECRLAFMASITCHFARLLLENGELSKGMNRNVIRQTLDQLERCVREVRRTAVPHNPSYLDRNVKKEKLLDMATIVDLVARVGIEENKDRYEEFLGLVIDCLDEVFYTQSHRRNMHFGKYKALIWLLTDEIKADVNGTPGRVLFTNKRELYLKASATDPSHEIK